MLKLASWNVNSLKVRLDQVLSWLETTNTDILALQETKLIDSAFPKEVFQERGYHVSYAGQKTYNGVAMISKYPMCDVVVDMPEFDDPQRRVLAVSIGDLRVINFYVPNGSAVDSDKYHYKLNWLNQAHTFIAQELQRYPRLAVVGDFNIAPEDCDVHDPKAWLGCVHVSPLEREAFANLLTLGLTDSFRMFNQAEQSYSWWDYRQAAFRRNMGLRIDHILLSESLKKECIESGIDKSPRSSDRPSDHAPIWVIINNPQGVSS